MNNNKCIILIFIYIFIKIGIVKNVSKKMQLI